MGMRRQAREVALQWLYEMDLCQKGPENIPQGSQGVSAALPGEESENILEPDLNQFCQDLIEGVTRNVGEIDKLIESHSTHWKISRMALVDRNILRMAVFELLYCKDIPASVSINEAIEIGKKFGTEESGSFINGVLDHIAKDLKKR